MQHVSKFQLIETTNYATCIKVLVDRDNNLFILTNFFK